MEISNWSKVENKLELVEEWSRKGVPESQICKDLRISRSTWSDLKLRYPELTESLLRGRAEAVAEIESALLERALGYEVEVTKVSSRIIDGKEVKFTKYTDIHYPPDVEACSILLNRENHPNGSDNP